MSQMQRPAGAVQIGWFNTRTLRMEPLDNPARRSDRGKTVNEAQRQAPETALPATPLDQRTPAEIDTELGQLDETLFHLRARRTTVVNALHRQVGDKAKYLSRSRREWGMSEAEALANARKRVADGNDNEAFYGRGAIERNLAVLDARDGEIVKVTAQIDVFEAEFRRRGGWTRAFIVRGNNGHIHSSMHCHTCRITTQFGWLPRLSGKAEEKIVEEAGCMACTVCYPSAPVDVLSRPSRIAKMPKLG